MPESPAIAALSKLIVAYQTLRQAQGAESPAVRDAAWAVVGRAEVQDALGSVVSKVLRAHGGAGGDRKSDAAFLRNEANLLAHAALAKYDASRCDSFTAFLCTKTGAGLPRDLRRALRHERQGRGERSAKDERKCSYNPQIVASGDEAARVPAAAECIDDVLASERAQTVRELVAKQACPLTGRLARVYALFVMDPDMSLADMAAILAQEEGGKPMTVQGVGQLRLKVRAALSQCLLEENGDLFGEYAKG